LALVDGHVRIGPPVARVGKIICIGLNYKDHAAETHLDLPEEPLVFLKGCHPSGPNDSICSPAGSKKADWEVELAVVIGKRGLYIREEESLSYVAGYCVFNRRRQSRPNPPAAGASPKVLLRPLATDAHNLPYMELKCSIYVLACP
jgi:hypothetical protein